MDNIGTCALFRHADWLACCCLVRPHRIFHLQPNATYYPQARLCRVDDDLIFYDYFNYWGECFCRQIFENSSVPPPRIELTLGCLMFRYFQRPGWSAICYNTTPISLRDTVLRIQRVTKRFLRRRRAERRLAVLIGLANTRLGGESSLCRMLPAELVRDCILARI